MPTPQPVALSGVWTIATLPSAASFPRYVAWASDRSPPGYMVSDGTSWSPNAGPAGTRGSLWTSASGAPSGSANANDQYLDTSTGDVYQFS